MPIELPIAVGSELVRSATSARTAVKTTAPPRLHYKLMSGPGYAWKTGIDAALSQKQDGKEG